MKDRGIITSAYICLEALSPFVNEFAYQLLNTYDILKVFYGLGSGTRQNLGYTDFKRLSLLFPPKDEQSAIVSFIEREVRSVLSAITRLQKEIELLREFQTRLVADVVIGKLDVRGATRNLPVHVDEPAASISEGTELIEEEQLV